VDLAVFFNLGHFKQLLYITFNYTMGLALNINKKEIKFKNKVLITSAV